MDGAACRAAFHPSSELGTRLQEAASCPVTASDVVCAIIDCDMTVGQPRAVVASSVAALGLASSLACGEIKKADDDSTMADAAEQGGEPDAMGAIDAAPARC